MSIETLEMPTDKSLCGTLSPYPFTSDQYTEDFRLFLQRTDQKRVALRRIVSVLPELDDVEAILDVGTGDGTLLSWFASMVARRVAFIEPNFHSYSLAKAQLPAADGMLSSVQEYAGESRAFQFVLFSHVMFHLPQEEWVASIERAFSWLDTDRPACILLLLQSRRTQCMAMLRHFGINLPHLDEIVHGLCSSPNLPGMSLAFGTDRSSMRTKHLDEAVSLCHFQLNCAEGWTPIAVREIESFLESCLTVGGYSIDCSQDWLLLCNRWYHCK